MYGDVAQCVWASDFEYGGEDPDNCSHQLEVFAVDACRVDVYLHRLCAVSACRVDVYLHRVCRVDVYLHHMCAATGACAATGTCGGTPRFPSAVSDVLCLDSRVRIYTVPCIHTVYAHGAVIACWINVANN